MKLEFDLKNVAVTEFGVGRDDGNGQTFVAVPVDKEVQAALREMVQATWDAMQRVEDGPAKYEPSEKYGSEEFLYLPLDDDKASAMRMMHNATNLDIDPHALDELTAVFCYFARLTDQQGRRLTALRRAAQFKGMLKSRNRLVHMVDDTLRIITDTVFKLDTDFDLLVDSANVYILRPSGFEFVGKLRETILGAARENIKAIQKDLGFVDFGVIEAYASKHPRAARYLASIRSQNETKNIDKGKLMSYCERMGVTVKEENGKLVVEEGHVMGFLEVLDRRLYGVDLGQEHPERYRAASRRKING